MKKFFILILAVVAGYVVYNYFYKKEVVEIRDNIIITQASGLDINAGPSPPPKYAHREGIAKNIGEKILRNILIKYSVGYDTLTATIGFLIKGESSEFNTGSVMVKGNNPQFTQEEIIFEEDEGL
jgi:hypothetical protein